MDRSASYSFQGFIYQFNKTLFEILRSSIDDRIVVEGIQEDIEIINPSSSLYIHCKYHESQENFSLSLIYKPLLLMMQIYTQNLAKNIKYILYAYFPNKKANSTLTLTEKNLATVLNTRNQKYTPIASKIPADINKTDFLSKLSIVFGSRLDDLVNDVKAVLLENDFSGDDVDNIIYPNAISIIGDLACKHDKAARTISKENLIQTLESIKTTILSKWALALSNKDKLLKEKRKQLKFHLSINARRRGILIFCDKVSDSKESISNFIADFVLKYNSKTAHIHTPIFCLECTEDQFISINDGLLLKNVIPETGYILTKFSEERFLREPLTQRRGRNIVKREFSLRLLQFSKQQNILEKIPLDDLYVIGTPAEKLHIKNHTPEVLQVNNLSEALFAMGINDAY